MIVYYFPAMVLLMLNVIGLLMLVLVVFMLSNMATIMARIERRLDTLDALRDDKLAELRNELAAMEEDECDDGIVDLSKLSERQVPQ